MWLPWEPITFIFRGYNPYIGGSKPSFFMVLGSKGRNAWKSIQCCAILGYLAFHMVEPRLHSIGYGHEHTHFWILFRPRVRLVFFWGGSASTNG